MTSRPFNKIFCIGMNKTGTSSLHRAFLALELRSLHHGPPESTSLLEHLEGARRITRNMKAYLQRGEDMLQDIPHFDAYSDVGPIVRCFDVADAQYPGSKFIYTCRNTDAWVESRRKHVLRNRRNAEKGQYQSTFLDIDVDAWVKGKERHLERVRGHFRDRPDDILYMDITEGDGYEALCPFLGIGLHMIGQRFPHANAAQRPRAVRSKA